MRSRLILKPGQRGTKKLLARYGDRLLYVRYRYDEERRRRFKTVELIVDEVDWVPPEPKVQGQNRRQPAGQLGGTGAKSEGQGGWRRWNPVKRLWELRYDRVVRLGLEDRIAGVEEL